MSQADMAYSDVTPGKEWSMGCMKSVWEFDPFSDNLEKFRSCLSRAQSCEMFHE